MLLPWRVQHDFRCEEFRNISLLKHVKRIAKLNRRWREKLDDDGLPDCLPCQAIISYVLSAACQKNGDFLRQIHPGRLTWNTKTEVWKMSFLFIWVISSSMFIFRGVQCKGGKIMFHGTVDNQVVNLKFLDDLGTGEPDSLQYDTRLKHYQVHPDSLASVPKPLPTGHKGIPFIVG